MMNSGVLKSQQCDKTANAAHKKGSSVLAINWFSAHILVISALTAQVEAMGWPIF